MSGGAFDYWNASYPLEEIAKTLKYGKNVYTEEEINLLKETYKKLRIAEIYAHEVEWWLSGDTGSDTAQRRIEKDIQKVDKEVEALPVKERTCSICRYCKFHRCMYDYDDFEKHPESCWAFQVEDDYDD
jgi:hypothetical protein